MYINIYVSIYKISYIYIKRKIFNISVLNDVILSNYEIRFLFIIYMKNIKCGDC